MTRIVAGEAGGRTLKVPPKGTRPTSERVREALFSRLDHLDILEDSRVLDLYAGSGALGLEAASRGAAHVDLVERSRPASQIIAGNIRSTELGERASVHTVDVRTFLATRTGTAALAGDANLVLLDPPYDIAENDLTEVLGLLEPWIGPDGLVVVERSSRTPEPTWPEHLHREDKRTYGETVVWFAGPSQSE
ncbi:MAG TPA: 16S rRNA (guanine(966)-N(2))-methyltransferase RsmD [Lacisediminihabitans sp.]|uniref:16S rRNA (guanine(966)-N(2))-methyltransferase RsmD n=1 Tax=Lacisediminihabitans sp. TaxID=2787631 RepID=UPI002ED7C6FD